MPTDPPEGADVVLDFADPRNRPPLVLGPWRPLAHDPTAAPDSWGRHHALERAPWAVVRPAPEGWSYWTRGGGEVSRAYPSREEAQRHADKAMRSPSTYPETLFLLQEGDELVVRPRAVPASDP